MDGSIPAGPNPHRAPPYEPESPAQPDLGTCILADGSELCQREWPTNLAWWQPWRCEMKTAIA